jgi:hypothetical protein
MKSRKTPSIDLLIDISQKEGGWDEKPLIGLRCLINQTTNIK